MATEREYIDIGDLKSLRNLKAILIGITPENSKIIDTDRFKEIVKDISIWEFNLDMEVNVKN